MYSSGRDACKNYEKCQLCGHFQANFAREKFLPDQSWAQDPVWLLQKNPLFSSYHLSKTDSLYVFQLEEEKKKDGADWLQN
jgi:hypothetical protein